MMHIHKIDGSVLALTECTPFWGQNYLCVIRGVKSSNGLHEAGNEAIMKLDNSH